MQLSAKNELTSRRVKVEVAWHGIDSTAILYNTDAVATYLSYKDKFVKLAVIQEFVTR